MFQILSIQGCCRHCGRWGFFCNSSERFMAIYHFLRVGGFWENVDLAVGFQNEYCGALMLDKTLLWPIALYGGSFPSRTEVEIPFVDDVVTSLMCEICG